MHSARPLNHIVMALLLHRPSMQANGRPSRSIAFSRLSHCSAGAAGDGGVGRAGLAVRLARMVLRGCCCAVIPRVGQQSCQQAQTVRARRAWGARGRVRRAEHAEQKVRGAPDREQP